jgi:hypothetical protein
MNDRIEREFDERAERKGSKAAALKFSARRFS